MRLSNAKTILIAPLDWGLGHASRCIPIIHDYLQKNYTIIVGGTKETNNLIQTEFPNLKYVEIPGYDIRYNFNTKNKSQLPVIIKQIPKILQAIKKEHDWLNNFAETNKIDLIISDNRYGLWHKNIKSIFITHQLFIKTPVTFIDLHRVILYLTRNFNEIWIPDFKDTKNNLSGLLSHKKPLPAHRFKFIGPLSRFSYLKEPGNSTSPRFDYLAIASGPQEQRENFSLKIIDRAKQNPNKKGVLVLGKFTSKDKIYNEHPNLKIYNYLSANELFSAIMHTKKIIAACGYSTIMDLFVLDKLKDSELYPIKGQTEQEYLYSHLKKYFYKND
jgi:predicted glycosyltransferase